MGAEISFDAYLRSLVSKDERLQDGYAQTDATDIFDFGLMAQTLQEQKERSKGQESQDSEQEKSKVERFPVLDGIRNYAKDHVLLVGRPGSGKSTALRKMLVDEAQKVLAGQSSLIPVLIELRSWRTSYIALIKDFFRVHKLRLDEATIDDLLFEGKLLLLVDGVNELPDARQDIRTFRKTNADTPMIFTTRMLGVGGDLEIEKKLEMLPLTEPQMRQFVQMRLPEQGNQMLQQLGDRLRKFGDTPLLLSMLCDIFQKNGRVPANLGAAFRDFANFHDGKLKEDVPVYEHSRSWWSKLLQELAFAMMPQDRSNGLRLSIPRLEAEEILTRFLDGEKFTKPRDYAHRWLEDLLKYHLIQVKLVGTDQEIEFRHQLIQEYYAAEYLLPLFPNLTDIKLQHSYLNYLDWTESLALMLELVEREEQAVRVVKLSLAVDLRLGARLAGAVKYGFQEKTVGLLIQEIDERKIPKLYAIELLGKTRSDYVINLLVQSLKDTDHSGIAADALGSIGSSKAVENLIDAVYNSNSYIRMNAIKALGDISNIKSLDALIVALQDDNFGVRKRVVEALGKIGNEEAIDALILSLQDDNSDIRSYVLETLSKIGDKKSIEALISALNDSDYRVRLDLAIILVKIGNKKAINCLITLLSDCDYGIRLNTMMALREIRSQNVIDALIIATKDSNYHISINAIITLGKIGNEKAIDSLINLLNDADHVIRWNAAQALGNIGNQKAVETLINLLRDPENIVVMYVSEALSKIGSEKAINALIKNFGDSNSFLCFSSNALVTISHKNGSEFLINALKHQVRNIRMIAAEALGKIGNAKAIDALIESLNTPDVDVRCSAVKALGKTGNNKAVDYLIKSLNDSEGMIYWNAVEALGEIGDEKAVAPMIHIFNNSESVVQCSIIDALGKIGNDASINYLIDVLGNDDTSIWRSSIKALGKIGNEKAINALIKSLNYPINAIAFLSAEVLQKLSQTETNLPILAKNLPHLLNLIPTKSSQEALSVITAIQSRCKYYNYAIYNTALQETENYANPVEKILQEIHQTLKTMSETGKYNINSEVVQIVEKNYGQVIGKNSGQAIGKNYANDPALLQTINEITQVLANLQKAHPTATEAEAKDIIEAEFKEIQNNQPNKWTTFRQQLLNPERWLNGGKATISEIAKHYAENSVFLKAGVAFLDGFSADEE